MPAKAGSKVKAKKVVNQWIGESGNKIELVISNNDAMALGALESLNENGKIGIPVFGVDALSEAIQKIKSGEMAGTVLNDAKNQADAILKMASNLSQGKGPVEGTRWRIEGNKVVRIPYVAVNKVNVLDLRDGNRKRVDRQEFIDSEFLISVNTGTCSAIDITTMTVKKVLKSELLKNIKEDDNPVVILVTLKPKKDNKQ